MKILIDCRGLSTPYENRGVGHHLKNLMRGLPRVAPDMNFVFLLRETGALRYLPELPNAGYHLMPPKLSRVWLDDLLRLPRVIRAAHVNCFHGPVALGPLRDVNLPLFSSVPVVATVHDMHVEQLDDPHMAAYRREWRYRLERMAVRRAARVVTVSEFTRGLVADSGLAPRDSIRVIPNSIEGVPEPDSPKENLILFIGDTAHKNTAAAVSVFRELSGRVPDWRFVMVGSRERIQSLAGEEAKELQAARILQIEENVADPVMDALYAKARILFMPSLSEGFGIPVLQAFGRGTCVVVSDRGALPEVGGDAAAYVNPLDTGEMVSALEGLMKNPSLMEALIERGRRRLSRFTWQEHLSRLADLFREVVQ